MSTELTAADLETVLAALDAAAEYFRKVADGFGSSADREARAWHLSQAEEYDRLAKRIREDQR